MAKYSINVIAHQLKSQRVANFGEIVDEKELNGNAQELEKLGFIKLVNDSVEEVEEVSFNLDTATKKELISFAKENFDLDLDEKSKKEDLLSIIDEHISLKEVHLNNKS